MEDEYLIIPDDPELNKKVEAKTKSIADEVHLMSEAFYGWPPASPFIIAQETRTNAANSDDIKVCCSRKCIYYNPPISTYDASSCLLRYQGRGSGYYIMQPGPRCPLRKGAEYNGEFHPPVLAIDDDFSKHQ